MNELRWNPTAKEWISYATHRQDRTFHPPPEYCPLCPTKSEDDFPTEVPRSSYEIVVFENKFPSFVPRTAGARKKPAANSPRPRRAREYARSFSTPTTTTLRWPR